LPFAIGAALGSGGKTVLLQGDGGFQLHIGEMSTAVESGAPIVICLFNDAGYGVLRALQKVRFEGRTTGVDIRTPDFVQIAQAMGVKAMRVADAAAFEPAFESAMAEEGPVLLDINMTALEPIRLFG
jgi:acetolactate synthase-1/2/3 large subunit